MKKIIMFLIFAIVPFISIAGNGDVINNAGATTPDGKALVSDGLRIIACANAITFAEGADPIPSEIYTFLGLNNGASDCNNVSTNGDVINNAGAATPDGKALVSDGLRVIACANAVTFAEGADPIPMEIYTFLGLNNGAADCTFESSGGETGTDTGTGTGEDTSTGTATEGLGCEVPASVEIATDKTVSFNPPYPGAKWQSSVSNLDLTDSVLSWDAAVATDSEATIKYSVFECNTSGGSFVATDSMTLTETTMSSADESKAYMVLSYQVVDTIETADEESGRCVEIATDDKRCYSDPEYYNN